MSRSTILAVLVAAMLTWLASPAWSIVHWDGSSSDDWHTGSNWVGGQVPDWTDDVYVTDSSHGTFVQLSENDLINFLFVDDGMQVSNAGNRFNIAPSAPLGPFPGVVIGDLGASLIVTEGPDPGFDLVTSRFEVSDGGSLSMFGGTARLTQPDSRIRSGGQLSGYGRVNFVHTGLAPPVLTNDGTIRPVLGGLTLQQSLGQNIDLDGPSNAGRLDVDDGTGLFSTAVSLHVEGETSSFQGAIDIGTDDTLSFDHTFTMFGGQLAFHGRTGIARLTTDASLFLNSQATTIDVVSGRAELNADHIASFRGTLTLADNTILTASGGEGIFQPEMATHIGASARLFLDFDGLVEGTVILPGATFSGPGQLTNLSLLTVYDGAKILSGFVTNHGLFQFRAGFATHAEVGSFANSASGVVQFEIFGPHRSDHDFLLVQGSASSFLNGTLDAAFVNYTPSLGERFTLMEAAGGFTGEFAMTTLPADPDGARWKVLYSPTAVTLALLSNGDFDGNQMWECADVNGLVAEIVAGNHDSQFDLTGDGLVDQEDLDEWLVVAGEESLYSGNAYLVGDANLDGLVNMADFDIWNQNKFTSQAAWCLGDFNADGLINGRDFLLWNSSKFMSADAVTVPESSGGLTLLWIAALVKLGASPAPNRDRVRG